MKVVIAIFSEIEAWTIPVGHVERLRRRFPAVAFVDARADDHLVAEIGDADAAFTWRLTPPMFEHAPRLRWVHSPAAGVGAMLFPKLVASPVVLTNSRGIHALSIAEHVLGVTLMLARHLHVARQRQLEKVWAQNELLTTWPPVRPIQGRVMGIVGLGAIGSEIARLAHACGLKVIATRRSPGQESADSVTVWPSDRLPDLLRTSDVVVLAVPLTRATQRLIGPTQLALMKPDAFLVNIGRGKLVDEGALVEALQNRKLGGAALDVFEHEPLRTDSPLWSLPNVMMTPHTAGIREDYWDAAVECFSENLERFVTGKPLLNVVDKQRGY